MEAICSYFISSLLLKKRFNEDCFMMYKTTKELSYVHQETNKFLMNNQYLKNLVRKDDVQPISAPTYQNVLDWIRKKHNLNIEVYRTACGYIGCIVAIPSGTDIKFLKDDGDDLPSGQYTTWEKACEATIQYCLENLI